MFSGVFGADLNIENGKYLFTINILFKNIRNVQYISKNNNREGVQCADKVVHVQGYTQLNSITEKTTPKS